MHTCILQYTHTNYLAHALLLYMIWYSNSMERREYYVLKIIHMSESVSSYIF